MSKHASQYISEHLCKHMPIEYMGAQGSVFLYELVLCDGEVQENVDVEGNMQSSGRHILVMAY